MEAKFVILGTGTSERVPRPTCVVHGNCATCAKAVERGPPCAINGPEAEVNQLGENKNFRRNTSAALCVRQDASKPWTAVVFDCGKSFYDQCLTLFPVENIGRIESIFITHEHADHFLGLDDLRCWTKLCKGPLSVFCSNQTFQVIDRTFPYLVDISKSNAGGVLPSLAFQILPPEKTIEALGFQITPVLVRHGCVRAKPFNVYGYVIEGTSTRIAYIPDTDMVPPSALAQLRNIDYLFIDTLRIEPHPSHFSLIQSLEISKVINPKKGAYFVAMNHELEHSFANETIQEWKTRNWPDGPIVSLGWDGLSVVV